VIKAKHQLQSMNNIFYKTSLFLHMRSLQNWKTLFRRTCSD